MPNLVRIGNAHGFWGDRLDAAAEMLEREPDLDFLTLDFLAEVSMSILAMQRLRDPDAGWPRDVIDVVRSLAPYWKNGGQCRIITNAGGLNPVACARACQQALAEAGCTDRTIVAVTGDDVLDLIRSDAADSPWLHHLDTGWPLALVRDRLVTANAYIGAEPLAQALARGADIVIAGRVADPSLTVAACTHAFGWAWNDWNRLAGATVAGHLIECGTQVTGGIFTDWLLIPNLTEIGFPIVEVADDGSFVVTKPRGTGGLVCEETVKEQLVYEIGDPSNYLSPDVSVSILSLILESIGPSRVRVSGAHGRPAPDSYKVSATYRDGFRAHGQLTIFGHDAWEKADRAGRAVFERLKQRGVTFRESLVECLGTGACQPWASIQTLGTETVLRVSVADDSQESVTRFSRELMPLITAGPPGTTGYAEGRPSVHPLFRFWPCLIARNRVTPRLEVVSQASARQQLTVAAELAPTQCGIGDEVAVLPCLKLDAPPVHRFLRDIAYARSGDKGRHANIGVVARRPELYAQLCRELTAARVAAYFGLFDDSRVQRYELPNLAALNFVLYGILWSPLCVDVQGKTLGQSLLHMPLTEASEP